MPDFPIVDSHVHLADPQRFGYAWTKNAPSLNRRVLPADLSRAAAPVEIAYLCFELHRLALEIRERAGVVLGFGELQQLGGVGDGGKGAVEPFELARELRALLAEGLGLVGGIPDVGKLELAAHFLQAFALAVVVKGTP